MLNVSIGKGFRPNMDELALRSLPNFPTLDPVVFLDPDPSSTWLPLVRDKVSFRQERALKPATGIVFYCLFPVLVPNGLLVSSLLSATGYISLHIVSTGWQTIPILFYPVAADIF